MQYSDPPWAFLRGLTRADLVDLTSGSTPSELFDSLLPPDFSVLRRRRGICAAGFSLRALVENRQSLPGTRLCEFVTGQFRTAGVWTFGSTSIHHASVIVCSPPVLELFAAGEISCYRGAKMARRGGPSGVENG